MSACIVAVWAMNVVDFDDMDDWGDKKNVRSTDDDYDGY